MGRLNLIATEGAIFKDNGHPDFLCSGVELKSEPRLFQEHTSHDNAIFRQIAWTKSRFPYHNALCQ
jgi:hypothetical protein